MAKMNEQTALSLVKAADSKAVAYSGEFIAQSEKALSYYEGLPFGDEEEGRSALISTDVQDVIEDDMPDIVETFLGSANIMKFEPRTTKEEDKEEAEQKTKYVNWLIRHQPESFRTLHGWFKDALIQKVSAVKYYAEDTVTTEVVVHEGIDEDEATALQLDLEQSDDDISNVEIVEASEQEDGLFNVSFRVTRGKQRIRIDKIPTESFIVSRYTDEIEEAEIVGDDEILTRGELLSQGYSKKLINRLTHIGAENDLNKQSDLKSIRFHDEDGEADDTDGNDISDWASEEILVHNRYVKLDYDGDGVAERRFFRYSGQEVLDNEPFNHVPYAVLSSILMPNRLIGRSRAELVMETQRAKSVMLRGAADNTYMVNNPRIGANENVDIDALLDVELNGVVQTKGNSNPGESIFPIEIPFIADKTLLMLNYLDQQRANRTGALTSSQGLNSDSLNQETATRFQGIEASGDKKIKLIARVFAETGIRKLYEGVAWMAQRHQNTEVEIIVTGEELKVNPSSWRHKQHVTSEVGLAISDNEESLQALNAILQDQLMLMQAGSSLVDASKVYNTRQRLTKAVGIGDVRDFYNNPEQPEELLMRENELLKQQVELLMSQQQQNPLAEVALIEAQAKQQKTQADAQLDIAKLLEDQRQFNEKMLADQQKANREFALRLTELEQSQGRDLNQEVSQNQQV